MRLCCHGCEKEWTLSKVAPCRPSVRSGVFYVLSSCTLLWMASCLCSCGFVVSTKKTDKIVKILSFHDVYSAAAACGSVVRSVTHVSRLGHMTAGA